MTSGVLLHTKFLHTIVAKSAEEKAAASISPIPNGSAPITTG